MPDNFQIEVTHTYLKFLKRLLYVGVYADWRIPDGNTMGIKLVRSTAPHFYRS
jgi:hypothetical protein